MRDNTKNTDRIFGRIKIGNEVFSGVIADRKATENIINAFDRPSSKSKMKSECKNGNVAENRRLIV